MLDSFRDFLGDYLQGPEAKVVFGITVVLVASTVFAYFVIKIRERSNSGAPSSGDHLSNFRDMYESGTISEFEFRRVKSELGDSIQQEVKPKTLDSNESTDLNDRQRP